jgi:hypothetical protein
LAHTYATSGFGKDELASTLVFLSVRCGAFGAGNIQTKLDCAFDSFQAWCKRMKKTSTIKSFSKEELKITSLLGAFNIHGSLCNTRCIHPTSGQTQ